MMFKYITCIMDCSRFFPHPNEPNTYIIIIFTSTNYNNIPLMRISHLFRKISFEKCLSSYSHGSIICIHISIMNARLPHCSNIVTNKTFSPNYRA